MAKGGTLLSLVLCHLNVCTYAYVHRSYCVCIPHILTSECYHCEGSSKLCGTSNILINPACSCIYMLACGGCITQVETPRIGSTVASRAAMSLRERRKPSSHPLVLIVALPWCHTSHRKAALQPPLLSVSYGILHVSWLTTE